MQIVTISASPDSEELDPTNDQDFTTLVRLHHRELLVYARALTRDSATARDIVQEAFIVAYEKVQTFDVTRDFPTWMRGIVRNKWREWVRKNKRYSLTDTEIANIDADIAAWQSEKAERESELFDSLRTCLHRLPENLSEAVHACYYEGRTG
ncbi:MAG: RNA polymerase sigma factor, partial [Verrucomicrobiota bacterium]